MPDLWIDLLGCLDITESSPEAAGVGLRFEARNQQLDYRRIFGGQLLGQFLRIAALVSPDKTVKSQHAVFVKEGRSDEPVQYEATLHHEGRSFASMTIVATQSRGVIATASISMHAVEGGREHQAVAAVPDVLGPEHETELSLIPWQIRTDINLHDRAAGPPQFEMWMRTPSVGAELAQALAAYATDLTLIGTALRPVEGVSEVDTMTLFTSAVTSHSMWFHRPFRTDDWLLLRQQSPVLAGGRCFGRGDVLTSDAVLVASYAQEALVRFTDQMREADSFKRRV